MSQITNRCHENLSRLAISEISRPTHLSPTIMPWVTWFELQLDLNFIRLSWPHLHCLMHSCYPCDCLIGYFQLYLIKWPISTPIYISYRVMMLLSPLWVTESVMCECSGQGWQIQPISAMPWAPCMQLNVMLLQLEYIGLHNAICNCTWPGMAEWILWGYTFFIPVCKWLCVLAPGPLCCSGNKT